MSSRRSRVPRSPSVHSSREGTHPSFAAQAEAPIGGSHYLRSSGKRPRTAKEADHYEALARKRSSSKTGSSNLEPVIISDDEGEDRTEPTFAWDPPQPQCKPGFLDSATIGGSECRSPADHDGLHPFVQPLAMIAPGQDRVVPDPNTTGGVLQWLDNALKQIISIIGVKWGLYAEFRPLFASYLEDVRRVGGVQLVLRCELKLTHWDRLALRAEKLAFFEPHNEIRRLMGEARAKIMQEREARAQQVLEQEAIAADLRERQHRLRRAMDTYASIVMGVHPSQVWSSLSTDVHRAYSKTMHTLYLLQREEDDSIAALSEERLEREAKAQVQARWEKEVADLNSELKAFTVLDCA